MDSAKRFIKSSAIYFVGSVLTKIIPFLLLPLYTSRILTQDMGYYDLSTSYLNMLVPIFGMEIWIAVMRYMFDYEIAQQKYKVILNGLTVISFSLILYSALFASIGIFTDIKYPLFIFIFGLLTIVNNVYSYIARGLGYNTVFAVSGIVGSLVNSISNVVMILVFDMTITSLYLAMIFSFLVQIIILEFKVHLIKNISFRMFDKSLIKSMVRFSLPLALNSVSFWFLYSYNRVGIANILGLSANGIYSIASKFTLVLGLVATCFSMAWQELAFSKGNERDNSFFYTKASNYYIKFLMITILLFLPAIYLVFPYFIDSQYREAYGLIPIYLLAIAISIFSNFLTNIFAAEKKTKIIFMSTAVSAAVNVALFHLLVGPIGIQAANIALLCGFIVNVIIGLILLNKSSKIALDYRFIILSLLWFGVAYFIYMHGNLITNIAFAGITSALSLFIFRALVKTLITTLKSKCRSSENKKSKD